MFMEVYNSDRDPQTAIGHATSIDGGTTWEYDRTVLNTGTHISFPYVFEWEGSRYLVPEEDGSEGSKLSLYKAERFPYEWERETPLVSAEHHLTDHFVFRWNGRWWILIGDRDGGNNLHAYYSQCLRSSQWRSHEDNPVVENRPEAFRPGGRPVVHEDHVLLFFQDCKKKYGHRVRAYELTELTPSTYEDREHPRSPILEPETPVGWNSGRMHHIDPWCTERGWLCAVDGDVTDLTRRLSGNQWSIGIYAAN